MTPSISVNVTEELAYIQLSSAEVNRTIEITPSVMADLDEWDVVVGIELLDFAATTSARDIASSAHLKEGDEQAVDALLKNLSRIHLQSGTLTSGSKVAVHSSGNNKLETC
ncbi:DUF2283 domain-containing protein [Corynebacterium lubricantis]|uniref:DUF2283 domain-containing protein n=1 Tax=Corynebacterium lubricantis TaxID=541095 RepID=UPI00036468F8|nr:DUF2283 domain-containing protein [Corynebacterium lubricantis]